MIWKYVSKGINSSKSIYDVVNFRGVQHVYLPAVWSIRVPPRVQGFLWHFSQNKIMICDNIRKRGIAKPLECVHCKEIESVYHLFFECIVARLIWAEVECVFRISVDGFESIAKCWLCNKKFLHLNVDLWGADAGVSKLDLETPEGPSCTGTRLKTCRKWFDNGS